MKVVGIALADMHKSPVNISSLVWLPEPKLTTL